MKAYSIRFRPEDLTDVVLAESKEQALWNWFSLNKEKFEVR